MFTRLRSCSGITVLFFVFSFVSIHVQSEAEPGVTPVKALADITFINGEWSGTPSDCQGCPPGCAVLNLQAGSGNNFTGTIQLVKCGSDCPFSVAGTISVGNNMVQGSVTSCPGGCDATFNASFSPSRTSMKLNAVDIPAPTCSSDTTAVVFTKNSVAVLDVSESSGIANQNVETTGVQWIDYNKDKRLDLYLVGHNGNVLFKNVGNGKFIDVTSKTNTGNNGKDARGASWADIDNDGDPDVFIANATGPPTLLLNKKKVFQDISSKLDTAAANASAGFSRRAGIWVDINNDSKSDLIVIFDGAKNLLYEQTGSLDFNDITPTSGFADRIGASRSALAADFDEDGYQDLYVINYGESNILYKNNGNNGNETFSDVTESADVGFNEKSVQATLADYDNDQDLDIFVVNSAGPGVLYENLGNLNFKDSTSRRLKKAKKGIAGAFFQNFAFRQHTALFRTAIFRFPQENVGPGHPCSEFKIRPGDSRRRWSARLR